MTVVIHHNPDCGTSRNVLEVIKMTGNQPVVIEYLNDGWTKPQLLALFAAANLSPRQALRTSKSPAKELGLTNPSVPDDEILEQMLKHPILVNRPIVCTPKGVKLCRPSEAVFELLDVASGTEFVKEDGEKIVVP